MNRYGLRLARFQAGESKDPSTRVGAAILRPDGSVASVGYNGFARGVRDLSERLNDRETKLALILHAEENAMNFAHEALHGYTLYSWPFMPCAHCASMAIQKGIERVVSIECNIPERWQKNMSLTVNILQEAGVSFTCYPESILGAENSLSNPYSIEISPTNPYFIKEKINE